MDQKLINRRRFTAMAGMAPLLSTPLVFAREPDELTRNLAGARAIIRFSGHLQEESGEGMKTTALSWIDQSAKAVSTFYGQFPVREVRINVEFTAGGRQVGGTAYPDVPPFLHLRVPHNVAPASLLRDDWVLVHEMVHLAFPHFRRRRHNWLVEGLAVYVEPIARIMAGQMTESKMWAEFMEMMPRGLPGAGDGGLEETRNHGRTYWGGAMFCLVCDIRIRQATGNRAGLRDALVAINRQMNFSESGELSAILSVGDRATGLSVLTDAWQEFGYAAVSPNLDMLWKRLGVANSGNNVVFNDRAPLAEIRRAITADTVPT